MGIEIAGGGEVASTGTGASAGNIILTGTGGDGTRWSGGTEVYNASVTSVDGDIAITGTGGSGTTTEAYGVDFWAGGSASSTGAGNITITGTGGTAVGGLNYGVYLYNGSEVPASGPGAITITGQAGAVSGSDLQSDTGANVIGGAGAGDVTLIGNTMDLADLTASSAEDIILKPRTAATTIGLNGAAGTLNLTATELGYFTPGGTLIIGDSAAGTGAVNIDAWALAGKTYDVEVHGGSIDFGGAVTFDQANDLTFNARAGDVTLDQTITKSGGGASTLLLKASNTIAQTATISSSSGALNVTEWADSDNSGAGAISVTGAAITSNGGNVILGGGTDPTADEAVGNAGNPQEIHLNGATLTSAAGNITLRGTGYSNAATADLHGIWARGNTLIQSTSGDISLYGQGGVGTTLGNDGWGNLGIYVGSNIAETTSITSADGDILLSGQAGTGDLAWNTGIAVYNGPSVVSTGTGAGAGNIMLTGISCRTLSNNQTGLYVGASGAYVSSADGDITLSGSAVRAQSSSYGINFSSGNVRAVNGDITVTGQADSAAKDIL
jgi:hypothetical protein